MSQNTQAAGLTIRMAGDLVNTGVMEDTLHMPYVPAFAIVSHTFLGLRCIRTHGYDTGLYPITPSIVFTKQGPGVLCAVCGSGAASIC